MTKDKLVLLLLEEQMPNIETMIESRAAQKLFDNFFVEQFWDLATEFLVCPESLRTMQEEEQTDELMDFAFGMFLQTYAKGYMDMARTKKRQIS